LALAVSLDRTKILVSSSASFRSGAVPDSAQIADSVRDLQPECRFVDLLNRIPGRFLRDGSLCEPDGIDSELLRPSTEVFGRHASRSSTSQANHD
jgi:hypothetical protein